MSGKRRADSGLGMDASRRDRLRLAGFSLLAVAAVAVPFLVSSFQIFQLTIALSFVVCLAGLDVTLGYAGIINVATAAFFGIGAYTTLVGVDLTGTLAFTYAAIPVAAIIGLVAGVVFAIPVVRLTGWNVALFTLGVGVAFPPIMNRYKDLTGGSQGIQMAKPRAPTWLPLSDDQWLYFVALAVTTILYLAYRHLVARLPGHFFLAIQDNELAARALGVDARRYKAVAFTVGCIYAAVGGSLYAMVTQFAEPQSFGVLLAITFLLGLVIGGRTWVVGPLVGGLFLEYARLYAEDVFQEGINLVYGIMLIVVLYLAPRGLPEIPSRLARSVRLLRERMTGQSRDHGRAGADPGSTTSTTPAVDFAGTADQRSEEPRAHTGTQKGNDP